MADEDNVEVNGPSGWSVKVNGKQVMLVIFIGMATGVLAWMLRDHDIRSSAQIQEAAAQRKAQLELVALQQGRLQDSLDTIVYVMSISPEERARLKLDMPPALRTRMLEQERR